jgi:hypothetical protein
MNVLNYKKLKQEFKLINFDKESTSQKKKKVIDGSKFYKECLDPISKKYWDKIEALVEDFHERH